MSDFAGLGDIMEMSGDSNPIAKIMWTLFKIAIVIFSASTTFLFFYTFAGGIFEDLAGASSPLIAGAAGVLVLDCAVLVWGYVRSHHATTIPQMGIALLMTVGTLVGSLITTGLYLALQSTFEVGIYDPAGTLTQAGAALHYFGLAIVILSIIANFAASVAYSHTSMGMRQATQQRQLAGMSNAAQFYADMQRTQAQLEKTLGVIMAGLPMVSARQGQISGSRYLNTHMQEAFPENGDIINLLQLGQDTGRPDLPPEIRRVNSQPPGSWPDLPPNEEERPERPFPGDRPE